MRVGRCTLPPSSCNLPRTNAPHAVCCCRLACGGNLGMLDKRTQHSGPNQSLVPKAMKILTRKSAWLCLIRTLQRTKCAHLPTTFLPLRFIQRDAAGIFVGWVQRRKAAKSTNPGTRSKVWSLTSSSMSACVQLSDVGGRVTALYADNNLLLRQENCILQLTNRSPFSRQT